MTTPLPPKPKLDYLVSANARTHLNCTDNSIKSFYFSGSGIPRRTYAPKPLHICVPLDTHSAEHRSPVQISTSFISNKTRKLLAACNRFVCVSTSSKTLLYSWNTGHLNWEDKVSSITCAFFCSQGKSIWLGTKSGAVIVRQAEDGVVFNRMDKCHLKPITNIFPTNHGIMTYSNEDGKICVWNTSSMGKVIQVQRVTAKTDLITTGGCNSSFVWTCKGNKISIHNLAEPIFTLKSISIPLRGANLGKIVSISAYDDMAYFGQNDGVINVFKNSQFLGSVNSGIYSVTALSAISNTGLWAGTSSGKILAFSIRVESSYHLRASLLREWRAHTAQIRKIMLVQSKPALLSYDSNDTICGWNLPKPEKPSISTSMCDGFVVNIVTWNIGSSSPNDVACSDLLGKWVEKADIVVIALQEVIDLDKASNHALNMMGNGEVESCSEHEKWQRYLETLLIPQGYALIKAKPLVGIMILLFVRHKNVKLISAVDVKLVRCGVGGTYGNKGAIVINFEMASMKWSFVNCHLAAGHSAIIQRNRDALQIIDTVGCQSDVCFFFGDTNYRINAAKEQAERLIRNQNWAELRQKDQLVSQITKNPSFCLGRFQEGHLNFPPTYKYDRGTNNYDTSEKQRVPSWCDRILFRGKSIKVLQYEHNETAKASDHKPVFGTYLVPQLVSRN